MGVLVEGKQRESNRQLVLRGVCSIKQDPGD